MKKQDNSYAKVRISFYETRFQSQTNQQLVKVFNQLANSCGWTAERSFLSVALINEMIRREINVSKVAERDENNGQIRSIHYVLVRYDEMSKSLIPLI